MRAAVAVGLALIVTSSATASALVGTERGDLIVGARTADTVASRGGNDRVVVWGDGRRDTVACGSGLDLVNGELSDVVASDCETIVRQLSRDRSTVGGAHRGTQAEPDSFS